MDAAELEKAHRELGPSVSVATRLHDILAPEDPGDPHAHLAARAQQGQQHLGGRKEQGEEEDRKWPKEESSESAVNSGVVDDWLKPVHHHQQHHQALDDNHEEKFKDFVDGERGVA